MDRMSTTRGDIRQSPGTERRFGRVRPQVDDAAQRLPPRTPSIAAGAVAPEQGRALVLALQAALAGGIAWFIANNLLHHKQPVFAPSRP
jgi:hypothetical protein